MSVQISAKIRSFCADISSPWLVNNRLDVYPQRSLGLEISDGGAAWNGRHSECIPGVPVVNTEVSVQ